MTTKKPALGRGLSALLENAKTDITSRTSEPALLNSITQIRIDQIETNPFQPRSTFDETELGALSDSIKQLGIIQPVTVRKMGYDRYQLISGERRMRASRMAGLTEMPAYIRVADDQSMLELALVENIQRQDLDPIEEAMSYKRLIEECALTQEQLSQRVGKQRSTVTNFLRLLKLPAAIQKALKEKALGMGHARSLINIESEDRQLAIFALALEQELSVRQMEELARGEKLESYRNTKKQTRNETPLKLEDKVIQKELDRKFKKNYKFKRNSKGGGSIILKFEGDEELKGILAHMGIS
jgi:ParB family chromosome partitioning protein